MTRVRCIAPAPKVESGHDEYGTPPPPPPLVLLHDELQQRTTTRANIQQEVENRSCARSQNDARKFTDVMSASIQVTEAARGPRRLCADDRLR